MFAVRVLALAGGLAAASAASAQPVTCAIADLPGLSRQFATISRSTAEPEASRATEFARLAAAILGRESGPGVDWATREDLPCDPAVRRRDLVAGQMAMVGYSAKEIADVLGGRLVMADLNEARLRLMAGQSRSEVADFLDARWREPGTPGTPKGLPPPKMVASLRLGADLETELELLAAQHDVPSALVRAMVAAESAGNARALSPAGAIGLMQLMPATAAALGVDPWQPVENLRGGITYIGDLLRQYRGDARLALIAYNAGPQHANRVRAGTAVAYRETRRYLDTIDSMYPLP